MKYFYRYIVVARCAMLEMEFGWRSNSATLQQKYNVKCRDYSQCLFDCKDVKLRLLRRDLRRQARKSQIEVRICLKYIQVELCLLYYN